MIRVLALIVTLTASVASSPIDLHHQNILLGDEDPQSYRLPNNTIPESYIIELRTDIHAHDESPDKFKFTGTVTIKLKALEDTRSITLHYRQIKILEASLILSENPVTMKCDFDEEREFVIFALPEEEEGGLEKDKSYTLEIKYEGTLREDNEGFYRSSYLNEHDEVVYLASTQFESTNARHAFPCYDEPGIRAEMTVIINHHKDYSAISNQPLEKQVPDPKDEDRLISTFKPTPKVQTYLLAFVISDFKFVSKQVQNSVPQKLFARPEAIDNDEGDFGISAGIKILSDLEKYLDTNYTLSKMDQVSVPDFSSGAMENWGLVTYREELLLFDPKKSSLRAKYRIASIIAHEYAHQFFGNLVAPEWWSYLWLNEGFATLYEFITPSRVYPEFRSLDFMVSNIVQYAMRADGSEVTRPMTTYAETPAGIAGLFDDIAYEKSGSVLRMWMHAITEEVFQIGLKNYLDARKLDSANSDHLGKALNEAAQSAGTIPEKLDFQHVVDSWSKQAGYPVIHVKRDQDTLTFSQSRFSYTAPETRNDQLWIVPLTVISRCEPTFNETKPILWLEEKEGKLSNDSGIMWTDEDWIIVNVQETGFYRVNYDDELWDLLIKQLNSDQFSDIHHINRAQLVDDSMNLARAGHLHYDTAFKIVDYLNRENDFVPWSSADNAFSYLNRVLYDSQVQPLFLRFISHKIEPVYERIGTVDKGPNEALSDKVLRNLAIKWACLSGNQACQSMAKEEVEKLLEGEYNVAPDLQETIFCQALRKSDGSTFTYMWARMLTSKNQAERMLYIQSLTCQEAPDLQEQLLNSSIEPKQKYRLLERSRIIQYTYLNGGKNGVLSTIRFLQKKWESVRDIHGSIRAVTRPVNGLAEVITTELMSEEYSELLDSLITAEVLTAADKSRLMKIPAANLKWREDFTEDLNSFFSDYFTGGGNAPMISTIILAISFLIANAAYLIRNEL